MPGLLNIRKIKNLTLRTLRMCFVWSSQPQLFPVRYKLRLHILSKRSPVFKWLQNYYLTTNDIRSWQRIMHGKNLSNIHNRSITFLEEFRDTNIYLQRLHGIATVVSKTHYWIISAFVYLFMALSTMNSVVQAVQGQHYRISAQSTGKGVVPSHEALGWHLSVMTDTMP